MTLCFLFYQIAGGTFDELSDADFTNFKHLLEVNVQGTFLVMRHILATMKTQEPKQLHSTSPERGTTRGTIVNIASLLSYKALPNMVQYVTSKHAAMGISQTAGKSSIYLCSKQ